MTLMTDQSKQCGDKKDISQGVLKPCMKIPHWSLVCKN